MNDNKLFVNLTNHKSDLWSDDQLKAAKKYGLLIDYPFPVISPLLDEESVRMISETTVDDIMKFCPTAVLCQGDYSATYQMVSLFKKFGVLVLSACSERDVKEIKEPSGETTKISLFKFVRFRKY